MRHCRISSRSARNEVVASFAILVGRESLRQKYLQGRPGDRFEENSDFRGAMIRSRNAGRSLRCTRNRCFEGSASISGRCVVSDSKSQIQRSASDSPLSA